MTWSIRDAAVVLLLLSVSRPADTVTLDWVLVGDIGNAPDTAVMVCCDDRIGVQNTTGYGAVDHAFRIARTELSTSDYVEFLNAIAASDSNGVYTQGMMNWTPGTVNRSGTDGSYHYSSKPGKAQNPMPFIDWYRAARFANWMHNGQPTGAQDATTTEDGAYTLLGQNPIGVSRNPTALYWIPTENEWYKAAFHVPGGSTYVRYATGTDLGPVGEPPPGGSNSANYCPPSSVGKASACPPEESNGPGVATAVAAYPESTSSWGVQDATGNLLELTEAHVCCHFQTGNWQVVVRGGPFNYARTDNSSVGRNFMPVQCNNCSGVTMRLATGAASCPSTP